MMQLLPRSWATAPGLGARTMTCTLMSGRPQAVMDAMQTWRQHPLAKQQPVLVEASAEEGEAEMPASDGSDTERLHQDTAP